MAKHEIGVIQRDERISNSSSFNLDTSLPHRIMGRIQSMEDLGLVVPRIPLFASSSVSFHFVEVEIAFGTGQRGT